MAETKYNPWDVLAWIAFGIVVVYFLAKAAGIISSPLSVDVAAIISASYFIGRQFMKLEYLHKDVEKLKSDNETIKSDISNIKHGLEKHTIEGHR